MACSCTGASTSSSIRPPALAVEAAAEKITAAVKVLIVCIIRNLDLRMRVIGHYHLAQNLLIVIRPILASPIRCPAVIYTPIRWTPQGDVYG